MPLPRAMASTTFEWEELPSLSQGLRRPAPGASHQPAWRMTMPMSILHAESAPPPEPFREVLAGLHVREILGDEVFEHFFGPLPKRP